MADTLFDALSGLNTTGAQNPYGVAATTLGQVTPQLISPYASTGKAIGISLGSVLLQSLLAYQAKSEASRQSLEMNSLANQMLKLQTPDERTAFIGGVDNSNYQGKLAALSTALTAQEIDNKQKGSLAAALETSKMKALQEFYASPEGKAQREFELNKIKTEAEARRTPMDEWVQREMLKRGTQAEAIKGRQDLQVLRDNASSGRQEDQQAWREKQTEIERQFKAQQDKFKIEFGTDEAIRKEGEIAAATKARIDANEDPGVARAAAIADVTQKMKLQLEDVRNSNMLARQQAEDKAKEDRLVLSKKIDREYPTAPPAVKTAAAEAPAYANIVRGLAADIRKLSSYPEYKTAKNISVFGDDNLKSRIRDAVDRLARVRSGLATRGAEDDAFETILTGDSSTGPQEAAAIMERVAQDTLNVAADKLAASTKNPTQFVDELRQMAKTNAVTRVQPQVFSAGGADDETKALEERAARLEELLKSMQGAK